MLQRRDVSKELPYYQGCVSKTQTAMHINVRSVFSSLLLLSALGYRAWFSMERQHMGKVPQTACGQLAKQSSAWQDKDRETLLCKQQLCWD